MLLKPQPLLHRSHGWHVNVRKSLPQVLPIAPCAISTRRNLLTLAIETSCDDTSVAVLEKHTRPVDINGPLPSSPSSSRWSPAATLHFHQKVTANTTAYNGIHPIIALESHQESLAGLVQKAVQCITALPRPQPPIPDFVSVTRGPGMRSNLSVGLDTAKGLATAWQVPLLGIHHMQAHALTPRLMSALKPTSSSQNHDPAPSFPFLSILVSGGHSMLINSTSLTDHRILATTGDIALGDCLDKAARAILPSPLLLPPYGLALERFAFPGAPADYEYTAPKNREKELERRITQYGWGLGPPLAESKAGSSSRKMVYSFSGLLSSIERFVRFQLDPNTGSSTKILRPSDSLDLEERREMAREVMRVAFEHLVSRVLLYLSSLSAHDAANIKTVVVSGGVAANSYLRHLLRSFLDVRGYKHIDLCFPPMELCTDNAAMIAWAGMEMWEAGWRSDFSIRPIKSWSLDPAASDGGIVGVDGWKRSFAQP